MNYLLDTHALLWFISGDRTLSDKSKEIIENYDNKCYVSIASFWEISIKISLNKLQIDFKWNELETFLSENEIEILPIQLNHLQTLSTLPFHHRDPFDRLLISQCKVEDLKFITKDENVVLYKEIKTIW